MPYFSACLSGPAVDEALRQNAADGLAGPACDMLTDDFQIWLKAPTSELAETFCRFLSNGHPFSCQEMSAIDAPSTRHEFDLGIDILLNHDGMPVQYQNTPVITSLCHNLPPLNEHALFARDFTSLLAAAGYGAAQIDAALLLLDGRIDPEHTSAGHSTQRHDWSPERLLQEALNEVLWLHGVIHLPEYQFSYLKTSGRYTATLCWYQGQLFCCEAETALERIDDWNQNVLGLQEDSMLARALKKKALSLPGRLDPVAVCSHAWQVYQQELTSEADQCEQSDTMTALAG